MSYSILTLQPTEQRDLEALRAIYAGQPHVLVTVDDEGKIELRGNTAELCVAAAYARIFGIREVPKLAASDFQPSSELRELAARETAELLWRLG